MSKKRALVIGIALSFLIVAFYEIVSLMRENSEMQDKVSRMSSTVSAVTVGTWSYEKHCPVHEGNIICDSLPMPGEDKYITAGKEGCGDDHIYWSGNMFTCQLSKFGDQGTPRYVLSRLLWITVTRCGSYQTATMG